MVHGVSDVTRFIKNMFDHEALLQNIMVRGEISNFKLYASGHGYFVLKDDKATLRCVLFRRWAEQLPFLPENGMQIIAAGNISVYERDGVYQLYVERVIPDGAGALAAAYEQLKARLSAEGLFDAERKKSLPPFPKTIGIVTSPSGAVLRDIFRVAKRRWPRVRLVLYPAAVQGEEAAAQVAAGILFFNEMYPVDVLIVGRGGGSAEDLWAFNEEIVVRAVAASRIPVISAVGHETDYTLADFAADVRAATPSQAAELAVPDREEMRRHVAGLQARVENARDGWMKAKRARLAALTRQSFFREPQRFLRFFRQRLDTVEERFQRLTEKWHTAKRQRLTSAIEKMELLSPVRVLRRGYGIISTPDGDVIRSIRQVRPEENVEVMLADGRFKARVTEFRKGEMA